MITQAARYDCDMRRDTWRGYAQAGVHAIAAVLLMAAALLKAYGLVAGPPEARPIAARVLELGLIEFELALAAMLLLGVMPLAARYLALMTFTAFALLSLRKAMSGSPSCGCFGPVDVDPRITAAVDGLIVVLLSVLGPPHPRPAARPRPRRLVWKRLALGGLVVVMIAAAGAAIYAAVPKRGLVVDGRGFHDFGAVAPDRAGHCEHVFIVRNTASRPLRITAFNSSCGCTVAELPSGSIPPGGTADVRVRADWTGVVGKPYARVTLKTDNFWTRQVLLTIHAEIAAAPAPAPVPAPMLDLK